MKDTVQKDTIMMQAYYKDTRLVVIFYLHITNLIKNMKVIQSADVKIEFVDLINKVRSR